MPPSQENAKDRNSNYVPDGLYLEGRTRLVEIAPPRDGQPVLARETIGHADEQNREDTWRWADVSGNGSHWSRFEGHHVQVDIELHTENRREVNDWKGRDEIRAEGTWTLALARQQVWEGFIRGNALDQLMEIRRITERLLHHEAIDWNDPVPAAEQLMGRRVYYQRTPAVVTSTSALGQGCVMLKPVGVTEFPPHISCIDRDEDDHWDRDEVKVELLSGDIWWWRDKPASDEEDLRTAPAPLYDPTGQPEDVESLRQQAARWELAAQANGNLYAAMENQRDGLVERLQRVRKVPEEPQDMNALEADTGSYLRGYRMGVLAAKGALRSPNEPTTAAPEAAPVSDDHPCAHCTHPKRSHLEDPVWCRNCPPDTSYNGDPGWHRYEPAKEQR